MRTQEQKRQFIAKLASGKEKAFESTYDRIDEMAQAVVRAEKLTTPRANPQHIAVVIEESKVVNEEIKRVYVKSVSVMPYLERMTQAEFDQEQAELLDRIPEEIRPALSGLAWDSGHSAGFEEVISHLSTLVDALEKPIETLLHRMRD